MNARYAINYSSRGSAIPAVILLTFVMLILTASFLSTVSNEKVVNQRTSLLGQARNGAESVAELALAAMAEKAVSNATLPSNPLSTYVIPADDIAFLSG